jgi:hypothetical protein
VNKEIYKYLVDMILINPFRLGDYIIYYDLSLTTCRLRLVAYYLSLATVSSVYLCINNLWTKIAPQKVAWHNFLNKLSFVFSQVVVTEGMGGEDSMVYDITLTEI